MGVVRLEGLRSEIRDMRIKRENYWKKRETLKEFLQDHFPLQWERVQQCGYYSKIKRDANKENRYKTLQRTCKMIPYCPPCSRDMARNRANGFLEKFAKCTPYDKKNERHLFRFIRIFQTAPCFKGKDFSHLVVFQRDGYTQMETVQGLSGWGVTASYNPTRFSKIVFENIKEMLGDGIGGVGSYQDFGEKGFTKRHPHMDITLNGWKIENGKPKKVKRFELPDGGYQKWENALIKRAKKIDPQAKNSRLKMISPKTSQKSLFFNLWYMNREMVDLNKLEYDRKKQTVEWWSYHDENRWEMTVTQFLEGLQDYTKRLGDFNKYQVANLHKRFGHMADRKVNETAQIMGSRPLTHRRNCTCGKCNDWQDVEMEEIYDFIE